MHACIVPKMTGLEKKLRAALRHLAIATNHRLLVAVSGGADSTALLDALVRLRQCAGIPQTIFAAHLNHLLRGVESDADEIFVSEFAVRLDVPFLSERADVAEAARQQGRNLEAVARHLRYEFLQRAARRFSADVVVTAHTRDDQVETLLMRLLRGSGIEGLRGIHHSRNIALDIKLIRPLLKVTRSEILAWCQQYELAFRTDSSNLSPDFTRNRVRHELLPLMQTFNPRFAESLLRLAERLAEDNDFIDEKTAAAFSSASRLDGSLEIKTLKELHPAVRKRVLREWLRCGRGDLQRIEAAHLLSMDSLLMKSENQRYVEIPGGWQVWRQRGYLILSKVAEINASTSEQR